MKRDAKYEPVGAWDHHPAFRGPSARDAYWDDVRDNATIVGLIALFLYWMYLLYRQESCDKKVLELEEQIKKLKKLK